MKVAVTGASGFLGRHVLKELALRPELQIVAATRRNQGIGDLGHVIQSVHFDLVESVPDPYAHLGKPDVVIHLAWAGLSDFKSLVHFDGQLTYQYQFLKALLQSGLPNLLCVGTCLEYGMRCGQLSEELVSDPRVAYAYAKDSLRRQLEFLNISLGFKFTWARLFYMYGPGQPAKALYPQLVSAVERCERTFRMSRGEQLRDYLPVAQIAKYLVRLAIDAPGGGIVNVCSGRPVSIRSLVEEWLRELHWEMELELGQVAYPDYEPMAFWGDTKRLQTLVAEYPYRTIQPL